MRFRMKEQEQRRQPVAGSDEAQWEATVVRSNIPMFLPLQHTRPTKSEGYKSAYVSHEIVPFSLTSAIGMPLRS